MPKGASARGSWAEILSLEGGYVGLGLLGGRAIELLGLGASFTSTSSACIRRGRRWWRTISLDDDLLPPPGHRLRRLDQGLRIGPTRTSTWSQARIGSVSSRASRWQEIAGISARGGVRPPASRGEARASCAQADRVVFRGTQLARSPSRRPASIAPVTAGRIAAAKRNPGEDWVCGHGSDQVRKPTVVEQPRPDDAAALRRGESPCGPESQRGAGGARKGTRPSVPGRPKRRRWRAGTRADRAGAKRGAPQGRHRAPGNGTNAPRRAKARSGRAVGQHRRRR